MRITLDVEYDAEEHDPPSRWDWSDLVGGYAAVVDALDPVNVEDEGETP